MYTVRRKSDGITSIKLSAQRITRAALVATEIVTIFRGTSHNVYTVNRPGFFTLPKI
jgi:hypothetical protein